MEASGNFVVDASLDDASEVSVISAGDSVVETSETEDSFDVDSTAAVVDSSVVDDGNSVVVSGAADVDGAAWVVVVITLSPNRGSFRFSILMGFSVSPPEVKTCSS